MKDVIELGVIEDSMVSKVMLQPSCLSLAGHHQTRRHQPRQPVVAKVPQHPPSQKMDDEDVSKQGNKEPGFHFEHALKRAEY